MSVTMEQMFAQNKARNIGVATKEKPKPKGSNDSFLGRKTNLFNATNLGGLGGAALGASIGSVVPGIGTIIGGIIGAGLGSGGGELARQQINDEDLSIGGALKEGTIGAGSQFIGGKLAGAAGKWLAGGAKGAAKTGSEAAPFLLKKLGSEADTIAGANRIGEIGSVTDLAGMGNRAQAMGVRLGDKFATPASSGAAGAFSAADRAKIVPIALANKAPNQRVLGDILSGMNRNLSGSIEAIEAGTKITPEIGERIMSQVTAGRGFRPEAIKTMQETIEAGIREGRDLRGVVSQAINIAGSNMGPQNADEILKAAIGTGVTPATIGTQSALQQASNKAVADATRNVNTFSDLGGRMLNMAQAPLRYTGRKAGAILAGLGDNLAAGTATARPIIAGAGRQITGDSALSAILEAPQQKMDAQNALEAPSINDFGSQQPMSVQGGFLSDTSGFEGYGQNSLENEANSSPFTPEMLQAMAVDDLIRTGGKNLSTIKTLGDMFSPKNTAPALGAAERQKLASANASLMLIEDLKSAIQQNPDILNNVGVKQRVLGPLQNFGIDTRSPQEQRMGGALVNALSELVQSVSGAAATDKEREFLAQAVPQMSNTPQQFMSQLSVIENRLRRMKSATEQTAGSTTLDNIFIAQ